jgi:hypothetical protein
VAGVIGDEVDVRDGPGVMRVDNAVAVAVSGTAVLVAVLLGGTAVLVAVLPGGTAVGVVVDGSGVGVAVGGSGVCVSVGVGGTGVLVAVPVGVAVGGGGVPSPHTLWSVAGFAPPSGMAQMR